MIKYCVFVLFVLFLSTNHAQDIKIGASPDKFNNAGGFYDYSDARYVNIMVNIWGYVKFPGKYYVPEQSTIYDLISYAGGPSPDAYFDDIRLLRNSELNDTLQTINIEKLLEKKSSKKNEIIKNPQLKAGDIVLLPGEPKLYFRDYVSLALSITSTLISLAILILNIAK